jgi:hypothetical protein
MLAHISFLPGWKWRPTQDLAWFTTALALGLTATPRCLTWWTAADAEAARFAIELMRLFHPLNGACGKRVKI